MWVLRNNNGEKWTFLKAHDFVPRPRVSWFGLKSFHCIFWNISVVLHDRLLGKDLTVTSDVHYQTLTHVADEYRSHYDKTAKSCGPLLIHSNACKLVTNQAKYYLLL